jgi:ribonuclease R
MHPPLKPKKGDTESPQNNEAREIPFIFRVHDLPDMSKVIEFARFAAEMGHPMKVDTPKQIAESFNKLMVAARKDDRLKILEPLAIRTMAKAVYSSNNIGHYGLGFSHYSHFTSPIRRYSDVLAHRILEQNLDRRTYRMDKEKPPMPNGKVSNTNRQNS